MNLDPELNKKERLFRLQELEKFLFMTYENAKLYKERSKLQHNARIKKWEFLLGWMVLLYNSRLKLFLEKLKLRWTGSYIINKVTPYGAIELVGNGGQYFLVNGQRVKHYFRGTTKEVVETQVLQCKVIWAKHEGRKTMEEDWETDGSLETLRPTGKELN